MLEVVQGGNPDRIVNQFEALSTVRGDPGGDVRPQYGGEPVTDKWGVTKVYPEGTPGPFPVHDEAHIVVKDIEHWDEYVHKPKCRFTEAEWEPFIEKAEAVDRNEKFVTVMTLPGLFERCHYLCEIQRCLINLYEYEDEMHELIKYLIDYELEMAEQICMYLKPDVIFRHDDWGTQISTFMSVDMFEEFYAEPTKELYTYFHEHGVLLNIHHSDSFCATLVPTMIDMGIDIWQGCLTESQDIPALIKQYGGQISFMGGIDSGIVDRADFTDEGVEEYVRKVVGQCGNKYFIPTITQGGPGSVFKGVDVAISKAIDKINAEQYGIPMP